MDTHQAVAGTSASTKKASAAPGAPLAGQSESNDQHAQSGQEQGTLTKRRAGPGSQGHTPAYTLHGSLDLAHWGSQGLKARKFAASSGV